MGLLDYRKLRILVLGLTGFMPLFFMTMAMGGFGLNWIGGTLIGIASLIILVFLSNSVLSKNPWIKAIDRAGILLFNLTSTGIVPVGIARIKSNPIGQKLFSFKQGNQEVTRLYDREVGFTLKEPLEGEYWIERDKENGKKFVCVRLEEDSYAKSVFFSDYMQLLIFNEQAGNFITKSELGDQERDKLITYLTLNEQREIRELKIEAHNLNRNYADKLHEITGGLAGSNIFKLIIIVAFIFIVGAIAWFYVPGLKESIMGMTQNLTGTVNTGLSSTPI